MKISSTDIIMAEIPIVQKIVCDECWYEGERRHCEVGENDKTVQRKVRDIIMKIGASMRCEVIERLSNE